MKSKIWFDTREAARIAAKRHGIDRLTEQRFLDRVTKQLTIRYFIEVEGYNHEAFNS